MVRAISKVGKKRRRREMNYGKWWLVESFFSVFKRWFGEYVINRRFENMLIMAGVV